jgi:hypothetical protein
VISVSWGEFRPARVAARTHTCADVIAAVPRCVHPPETTPGVVSGGNDAGYGGEDVHARVYAGGDAGRSKFAPLTEKLITSNSAKSELNFHEPFWCR